MRYVPTTLTNDDLYPGMVIHYTNRDGETRQGVVTDVECADGCGLLVFFTHLSTSLCSDSMVKYGKVTR